MDNHAQYCSVVRTGIGTTNIILGGEVDGVWDAKPTNPSQGVNWVELKTTARPNNTSGSMLTYERKLLKYWIQSFLLGVPKIVVGFRNQQGILVGQEELETRKIPGNVKRVGQSSWDGNVCINFTAALLERSSFVSYVILVVLTVVDLRNTITSDGVWRIRHKQKAASVEIWKMEDSAHGNILSPDFKSWRQQTLAKETADQL